MTLKNLIYQFAKNTLFIMFIILCSCTNEMPPPINVSKMIPVDVNPDIQKKLKMNKDNLYSLNKEFNRFSWETFIAIFWPLDTHGEPMDNFVDEGNARWTSWKEAYEVFKCKGEVPDSSWGSKRSSHRCNQPNKKNVADKNARLYLESVTPAHRGGLKNFADEENQAFAGKLYDQNGNKVYYEVLMNKAEFDYIISNKLYNINGQIQFASKKNQIADFPRGDYKTNVPGSIEIKIAWKILLDSDIKERYYSSYGYIPDASGEDFVKVELGMIGLHIGQKTPTAKQWVWSTFEHIDNLSQNTIQKDGKEVVISPSLTNPDCELCPVNLNVVDSNGKPSSVVFNKDKHSSYWTIKGDKSKTKYYADGEVFKTQAKRIIDIPIRVQLLNQEVQSYFKSIGSVFQYYKLIDTQYPTEQKIPPANNTENGYTLPESVANKTGGNPNLAYLTNITMETFFQKGNQPATHFIEGMPKSDITVHGSESCIGCHSSAPIYNGIDEKGNFTKLSQLSGDFSWLLQRAEWNQKMLNPN